MNRSLRDQHLSGQNSKINADIAGFVEANLQEDEES